MPRKTIDKHLSYGSIQNTKELSKESITLTINPHTTTLKHWEFPGWGKHEQLKVSSTELQQIDKHLAVEHPKLSEWPATAICGNDILSSCLYVSGLVASKAGKLAPVALALVAAILYLYRFIYGEVVNAIPLNGGSYNVLLNTTSKRVASFAASLAILSYIATGVVSGTSACTYLSTQLPWIDVTWATVCLLLFFAILSFIGITESSIVALIMFIGHTVTLIILCGLSIYALVQNQDILWENFQTDYPSIDLAGTWVDGNVFTALFYGLATAMLGISGFESSSQFVEEQQEGVFPKTLRNMWWGVAIFNPLISFLSLGVMRLEGADGILANKNTVLAKMGLVVGGPTLQTWVSIDAFIVLSGAVLTAYVGITGLLRRLASDRVLPGFLLHRNKLRGTNHFIIFGYFLVASSLVIILNGSVETLSGVYTYAFLGLMILFATGCMLLKYKRAEIPRNVVAPWWSCIVGAFSVFIGFMGNLFGDPTVLTYFSLYFLAVLFIVSVMFERSFFLRIFLYMTQRICPSRQTNEAIPFASTGARGGRTLAKIIYDINQPPILFFCKKLDLSTINKAILYVRTNEQTSCLRLVHIYGPEGLADNFIETAAMFDTIYPKLKIDLLTIQGQFGPAMIEFIHRHLNVPKNMMFIKQTDSNSAYHISKLGGVRVITG